MNHTIRKAIALYSRFRVFAACQLERIPLPALAQRWRREILAGCALILLLAPLPYLLGSRVAAYSDFTAVQLSQNGDQTVLWLRKNADLWRMPIRARVVHHSLTVYVQVTIAFRPLSWLHLRRDPVVTADGYEVFFPMANEHGVVGIQLPQAGFDKIILIGPDGGRITVWDAYR